MHPIVLASTSPYRRALLERLGLPFVAIAPEVEEATRPGESPHALAARLAEAKARSVGARYPGAVVIGSDQVSVLDGRPSGKPGDARANVEVLMASSGRRVEFLTGLCVIDGPRGQTRLEVVPYSVWFRPLERRQAEAYVAVEQAWDCAGGFRCEGLGAALFDRMEGEDPTALVGLPLIALTRMLGETGIDVLLQAQSSRAERLGETPGDDHA
jgi:septum formation protein